MLVVCHHLQNAWMNLNTYQHHVHQVHGALQGGEIMDTANSNTCFRFPQQHFLVLGIISDYFHNSQMNLNIKNNIYDNVMANFMKLATTWPLRQIQTCFQCPNLRFLTFAIIWDCFQKTKMNQNINNDMYGKVMANFMQ